MAKHMKAWQVACPGQIEETLKLVDNVPQPSPTDLRPGEILVEVASAGINPADYKTVQLGIASKALTTFPKTPGMDLSGRVVAVAKDVTDVSVGSVVIGRVDPTKAPGALAQFAIVSRDGYAVLPPDFDLDKAAGFPTTGLTAYQTMAPYVKPGDKIFINGGSGGVGTFGIQIAKELGLHVTVSCSTPKKSLCEELGADEIIDYRTTDVVEHLKKNGQVYSLVVDNVGNSPPNLYQASKDFLRPEGAFIVVGGSVSFSSVKNILSAKYMPSFLGGGKAKFVMYMTKNDHEDLGQVAQWLGQGKLKTVVDSTFEFEDAIAAFTHLKKGSSGGKVIVHVAKKA